MEVVPALELHDSVFIRRGEHQRLALVPVGVGEPPAVRLKTGVGQANSTGTAFDSGVGDGVGDSVCAGVASGVGAAVGVTDG